MNNITPSQLFSFREIVSTLKTHPMPDGYRPFELSKDDIPISTADLPRAFQDMQGRGVQSALLQRANEFFQNLGVKIKNEIENQTQITPHEALLNFQLVQAIRSEKTPIKFRGDALFQKHCQDAIAALFSIPSGRHLILNLCRSTLPIFLTPADVSSTATKIGHADVSLDFSKATYGVEIDTFGKRKIRAFLPAIMIAHELIHVLHALHRHRLEEHFNLTKTKDDELEAAWELKRYPSSCADYNNLEELLTIEGINNRNFICENMIRFELKLLKRYGHCGSHFPPLNLEDPNDDPDAISDGFSRINYAAILGDQGEVEKLLKQSNVQDALKGAARGGNLDLMQMLIQKHGADIRLADECGSTLFHEAAEEDRIVVFEFLKANGFRNIDAVNQLGRTALHNACMQNRARAIFWLVTEGASLNIKTLDDEPSRPLDFLVMNRYASDSVKFLLDAGAKMRKSVLNRLQKEKLNSEQEKNLQMVLDYRKQKKEMSPETSSLKKLKSNDGKAIAP